jgi:hypothetical protein
MKKYIFITIAMFAALNCKAQWVNEVSDNGFDPKFHYSTCNEASTTHRWLKVSKMTDSTFLFLVYLGYVCTETPTIEYSFKMDTGWTKYTLSGLTSKDKKKIYLTDDLVSHYGDAFAKCSILKIRVDDSHCGKNIYEFNMTGSSAALEWVRRDMKPKK